MVDKEGTDGEEEARKAYRAAREDSDHAVDRALGDKVSSALRDRVRTFVMEFLYSCLLICLTCHL